MQKLLWLLALVAASLFPAPPRALAAPSHPELRVYFFDVGQGDAELIVSPTGKTVLIDAGPPEAQRALAARLRQLLHAPLDLALLTHPHLDHLGGMRSALAVRGAKAFMDSGFRHPSAAYAALLTYLSDQGIRVLNATQGRKIDLGGGAVLTLLAPPRPFFHGTRSDPNANSVVARLTYGARSVLFSGDAEAETEAMLVRNGGIAADVLKVPHHGSRYSSTEAFLAAVKPKVAVISCGVGNDYGHPAPEALARLAAIGARIYRTDVNGEVDLTTDGQALNVHPARSPATAPPAGPLRVPAGPLRVKNAASHPSTARSAQAADGYVASRHSRVFHRPDCRGAEHIKPDNRVVFSSRQAAIDSGRHPAKDCNP